MKSQIITICNPRKFWSERRDKKEDFPTIDEVYAKLSDTNKNLINKFLEYKAQDPISTARVSTIKTNMVKFAATFEKDISTISVKDMRKIMKLITGSKFKPSTQILLITDIKQFYKFSDKQKKKKRFAELFEDIKMPKLKAGYKFQAKDLVTEEKFAEILQACGNSRDRFFLALIRLDTAIRPTEARNLRWGDLSHDGDGYFITVKTLKNSGDKENRIISLINSEPYLTSWMADYPGDKDNKENFIFVTHNRKFNNEQFGKSAMQGMLNRIRERIGFKNHLNSYLFRHIKITDWMKNSDSVMSIPIIKKLAGHKKHSNVIMNYTHISDDDVRDAQLRKAGRKSNLEKAELELKPIICPSCKYVNTHNVESCLNKECGFLINTKRLVMALEKEKEFEVMKQQIQEIKKWVAENPTNRAMKIIESGEVVEVGKEIFYNSHTKMANVVETPILADKYGVYKLEELDNSIKQVKK